MGVNKLIEDIIRGRQYHHAFQRMLSEIGADNIDKYEREDMWFGILHNLCENSNDVVNVFRNGIEFLGYEISEEAVKEAMRSLPLGGDAYNLYVRHIQETIEKAMDGSLNGIQYPSVGCMLVSTGKPFGNEWVLCDGSTNLPIQDEQGKTVTLITQMQSASLENAIFARADEKGNVVPYLVTKFNDIYVEDRKSV